MHLSGSGIISVVDITSELSRLPVDYIDRLSKSGGWEEAGETRSCHTDEY